MSTTIIVTKNDEGKLEGVGMKCKRALAKFNRWMGKLEPGEIFTLEVWFPRNPRFHKLHFVMLTHLFDGQEAFNDPEHLREWLTVGAGFATFYPGPTGNMVAIPDSIKWSKMDDAAFADYHQKVKDFMRSAYAQKYLWPHLKAHETGEIVEGILAGIEQ